MPISLSIPTSVYSKNDNWQPNLQFKGLRLKELEMYLIIY